jgi:hypothetical protein
MFRFGKWIRLTRSILLDGHHAGEGSIHYVAQPLADDLIAQGSAVRLNFLSTFVRGFWFSSDSRKNRATFPIVNATEVSKRGNWSNATESAEKYFSQE